jgi:RHS repeat-associated protein
MLIKEINSKKRLKLTLLALLLLLSCGVHAQIYVNSLSSNNLAPGTYYNNSSITLTNGFSVNGGVGTYVFYIPTDCVPLVTSQSASQNYIMTSVPRTQMTSIGNSNTSCTLMQTIQYFDGVGRPLQTVQVRGSATGNDLVQPFAYDQFGRETTKYLPYAIPSTTISDGSYKPDALTASAGQALFYNSPPTGVTIISTPRTATAFEPSPLNRVLEQGAPGDAWQLTGTANVSGIPAGHTQKIIYALNDGTTYYARLYTVSIDANNNRTLLSTGNYTANQLQVTVEQNENWTAGQPDIKLNTAEEYKDKLGHVILKRTYNYTTALQVLSTYYVYDDLGNLAYVLPPAANADSAVPAQMTLNNLCYQYGYDNRNRMITKQLPGKGLEEMVYNLLDQVIFTRDAAQAGRGEWGFVKYDALGRVIMTGIEKPNTATRSVLQSYVTSVFNNPTAVSPPITEWETPSPGSITQGYTNTAFPTSTSVVPLVVNYYDDYTFQGQPSTVAPLAGASTMTKGLLTATKTAVLNTIYSQTAPDMLWTVHYYDDLGRVTQTYAQHYLGGALNQNNYDVITNTYDFTNEVTATNRTHYNSSNTTTPAVTIANTYLYDHMGRKKQTLESINGAPNVLLSQADYNEIGQVMTKHLHSENSGSSFLQNIAYAYNERGWLRTAATQTSNYLNLDLRYNTADNPSLNQFNGNIAQMNYSVARGNSPGTRSFTYQYDVLNRLTNANSANGLLNESMSYDLTGNIITLNRTGVSPATLAYTYLNNNQSNQLGTVTNGGNAYRNYGYDLNGNATSDGMGKTITYNVLNLPQTVSQPGNSNSILATYMYDAGGQKLRNTGSDGTWDYISGIVYKTPIGSTTASISFIQTEEGRGVLKGDGSYSYQYNIKDQLGNDRLSFDKTGILQEDEYYAFGLRSGVYDASNNNRYLYNGKERQTDLTDQYDYGARFYDPVIARWTSVDPLAETDRRWSPYNYGGDNSIRNIDPDGMALLDFNFDPFNDKDDRHNLPDFVNHGGGSPFDKSHHIDPDKPGFGEVGDDQDNSSNFGVNFGFHYIAAGADDGKKGGKGSTDPGGSYKPVPQPYKKGGLPGFPGSKLMKNQKGARTSWDLGKGKWGEWDAENGKVEVYDKNKEHVGEFDPETGAQTKPANSARRPSYSRIESASMANQIITTATKVDTGIGIGEVIIDVIVGLLAL